jgi:hypothetical protein
MTPKVRFRTLVFAQLRGRKILIYIVKHWLIHRSLKGPNEVFPHRPCRLSSGGTADWWRVEDNLSGWKTNCPAGKKPAPGQSTEGKGRAA